jgi:outer membrane protein assembly factor BamB
VADGKVCTLGVAGVVSCLDAATGKVVWRHDTKAAPMFSAASSPLIVDGMCVTQVGGNEDGAIIAYDLASGDEKWKRAGGGARYSSPVVMTVGDTKLIVAETSREIVGVTAADGKLAWEAPCQTRYNAATPVVDSQTVIYEGTGNGERALRVEKQGDGFATKELWTNPDSAVIYDTPVLKGGNLFGLSQRNQFFCIDAQNGKTAWTAPAPQAGGMGGDRRGGQPPAGGQPPGGGGERRGGQPPGGGRGRGMGGGMGGSGFGSIVDAGPVLLALTPAMQLLVIQPSDKEYKQLASYKVADTQTFAYPVVSGNRVFIKDQDSLTLWTIE